MASEVSLVMGYLLSPNDETVRDGLAKIEAMASAAATATATTATSSASNSNSSSAFAVAFAQSAPAVHALLRLLARGGGGGETTVAALRALCVVLQHCGDAHHGARTHLIREVCNHHDAFRVLERGLSSLSDAGLPLCLAALHFCAVAASYAPRVLLVRFRDTVPLHLECFRAHLTYTQRRVRDARVRVLLQLVTSRYQTAAVHIVCTHGYLTQLLDDAAGLMQEGTPHGLAAAEETLRVLEHYFVLTRELTAAQKRSVLLAQRNVLRLLVKAVERTPVAETAAQLLYRLVLELRESPANYASTRVEAADEHGGMPNYLLFFVLRHLRPAVCALASRLVVFILTTAPDLIRPYFVRLSGHLAEAASHNSSGSNNNSSGRRVPWTARIATVNVLTRILLAPLPYHLTARRVTLQAVSAKTTSFYAMSPRDVADEVCAPWVSELVHSLINHSSNLLLLALAMQLTYAGLQRAERVLAVVAEVHAKQQQQQHASVRRVQRNGGDDDSNDDNEAALLLCSEGDGGGRRGGEEGAHATSTTAAATDGNNSNSSDDTALAGVVGGSWSAFRAQVHTHLLTALPRHEEFWHRMTQQLHPMLLERARRREQQQLQRGSSSSSSSNSNKDAAAAATQDALLDFVVPRMLLLMHAYTRVFDLRVSWMSAAPTQLPLLLLQLQQHEQQRQRQQQHRYYGRGGGGGGSAAAMYRGGGRGRVQHMATSSPAASAATAAADDDDKDSAMTAAQSSTSPIAAVLCAADGGGDVLHRWRGDAVAALCALLVRSYASGAVSMARMHHVNMSSVHSGGSSNNRTAAAAATVSSVGGVTEWPLLLSLLHWVAAHQHDDEKKSSSTDVAVAVAWVARLVQWAVYGVTVRRGCGYAEALLWTTSLPPHTLPCFVHLLNTLLQRSLSKAAERVAEEMADAHPHGVLVAAADVFVSKMREKFASTQQQEQQQQQQKQHSLSSNNNNNRSTTNDGWWHADMQRHLDAFATAVDDIRRRWPTRHACVAQLVLQHHGMTQQQQRRSEDDDDGDGQVDGQPRRVPSTMTRAAATTRANAASGSSSSSSKDDGKGDSGTSGGADEVTAMSHTLMPPHAQLLAFCQTLHAPASASMLLLSPLQTNATNSDSDKSGQDAGEQMQQLQEQLAAQTTGRVADVAACVSMLCALRASRWCTSTTLCWEVAGGVLRALRSCCSSTEAADAAQSPSVAASLRPLCASVQQLLTHVAEEMAAVQTALRDVTDDSGGTLAFAVLVLVCLRVLLARCAYAADDDKKKRNNNKAGSNNDDNEDVVVVDARITTLLLQRYTGTLSTADRVRYACLLSLHYLHEAQQPSLRHGAPPSHDDDNNNDNTHGGDDGSDGDEDNNNSSSRDARRGRDRCERLFAGAVVLHPLQQHRYRIHAHCHGDDEGNTTAAATTPEADMLAFLLDTWTDAQLQRTALDGPARLHHTLLLRSSATQPGWDVLRSVFCEVTCVGDVLVMADLAHTATTSSALLDLRYVLPLVQTVLALPAAHLPRRAVGVRCLPLLLRALSFTELSLRTLAAAALAAAHLPPGPSRIVASFARMKLLQLSHKRRPQQQQQQQHHYNNNKSSSSSRPRPRHSPQPMHTNNDNNGTACELPRLPAPLSAFLVLALRPLTRYDDVLHHHMVRFLFDTHDAFATAVPLAQFLSAFPLDTIATPLMLEQQQQQQRRLLQQHRGGGGHNDTDNITTAAAAAAAYGDGGVGLRSARTATAAAVAAAARLRDAAPPHLDVALQLVRCACQTNGDAAALLQSECVQRIVLLVSLVSASTALRTRLLECVVALCATSYTVAMQLAVHGEVLVWLVSLLHQLCAEAGTTRPHAYGEPPFTTALNLLARLCYAALSSSQLQQSSSSPHYAHTIGSSSSGGGAVQVVWQLRAHLHVQLLLLRNALAEAHVTAKDTLDTLERLIVLCSSSSNKNGNVAHRRRDDDTSNTNNNDNNKRNSGGRGVRRQRDHATPSAPVHTHKRRRTHCGQPARFLVGRDGRPAYTCPLGRCRLYALAPVQCEGYHRIVVNATTPTDALIVRFEALLHPTRRTPAVMACCEGTATASSSSSSGSVTTTATGRAAAVARVLDTRDDVRRVLHSSAWHGEWYVTRAAYVYDAVHYPGLVAALRALPRVLVQDIPTFFFRCVEQLRQVEQQQQRTTTTAAAAAAAEQLDPDDCVVAQLRPFQRAGVQFLLARGGRGMLADDMGLGKTVQAIAVAHHYRAEWPVLVVCPMSLMENWAKEFNRFCSLPFARMTVLQGTKARPGAVHDIVIASYASLRCVEHATFGVVVVDESHYIKAGDTKRTQLTLQLCRRATRVVLLSGTPAVSRPVELYTQMQAIAPTRVPTRSQFCARYCNSYVSRFGVDVSGHSHEDELHYLLQFFMIRRTKKELGSELPSKTRQLLYVYVTDRERKALEKQVLALRRSLAAATTSSTSVLYNNNGSNSTTMTSCMSDVASRAPNAFEMKIATARAKMAAVQDYVASVVEQHVDAHAKVIIFAHHQCMMEAIKVAVEGVRPRQPLDYIYITGETSAVQREQLLEHFRRAATCAVAILSMQSSGTGHNLTCASTVVFAELDWNPSTHLQCEDRVHRMGQSEPCTIKYLLAEGTSDAVIWPLLQSKLTVTTAVLESSALRPTHGQLLDGDDTQQVTRRDAAAATATTASAQTTLDGFLQPAVTTTTATKQGVVAASPMAATTTTATTTTTAVTAAMHSDIKAVADTDVVINLDALDTLVQRHGGRTQTTTTAAVTMTTTTAPAAAAAAVTTTAATHSPTLLDLMQQQQQRHAQPPEAPPPQQQQQQSAAATAPVGTVPPTATTTLPQHDNNVTREEAQHTVAAQTTRAAAAAAATHDTAKHDNNSSCSVGGGHTSRRRTTFVLHAAVAAATTTTTAVVVAPLQQDDVHTNTTALSSLHTNVPATACDTHSNDNCTSTTTAAAAAAAPPHNKPRRVTIMAALKRPRSSEHAVTTLPAATTTATATKTATAMTSTALPSPPTTPPRVSCGAASAGDAMALTTAAATAASTSPPSHTTCAAAAAPVVLHKPRTCFTYRSPSATATTTTSSSNVVSPQQQQQQPPSQQ